MQVKPNRHSFDIILLALLILAAVIPASGCQAGSDFGATLIQAYDRVREWFIMQGAQDRIEKIRKGDALISVIDDKGNPVRDARVYYEQESHDFLFGSSLSPLGQPAGGPNAVNQKWAEAYVALFNYGTLPFNWDSYEPRQGQTAEQLLRAMADWARKRGIATKGQPLVSANYMPPWVPPSVNDMQIAQEKRVKSVVGAFCGLVDYWDAVVDPTMAPLANNPIGSWMSSRSPAVACTDVLNWARSACPKATLIINDFRTDQDFRELLQGIIRQKGKFDAIGIEAHMHRGNWPLYQMWDICDRFKDFNVPVHITEVAILSGDPLTGIGGTKQTKEWPSTPEGELAQAEYVEKFYTLLFSHPSVEAISWWDFSDLDAWQGAPAGLLRKDMTKKPAYERLYNLIRKTWWSFGDAYTNMEGKASFRGYYGNYKVIVEKGDMRTDGTIHLAKGLDNRLELQLKGYIQPPPTPLWEQVWPYLVAAAVIAIIVLIIRWIIILRRRI